MKLLFDADGPSWATEQWYVLSMGRSDRHRANSEFSPSTLLHGDDTTICLLKRFPAPPPQAPHRTPTTGKYNTAIRFFLVYRTKVCQCYTLRNRNRNRRHTGRSANRISSDLRCVFASFDFRTRNPFICDETPPTCLSLLSRRSSSMVT